MADSPNSSGFSHYLKPALMGLVMFIMAGLGAWAASSLRGEKPSVNEENPAGVHADTQNEAEFSTPAESDHDAERATHSMPATALADRDDRATPAAGPDETDGSRRNNAAQLVVANPYPSAAREERLTREAINLMASADEQLASGSYAQAMGAYQELRQKSGSSPSVAILLRLALCAEAAGRHAAAIEAYREPTHSSIATI